MTRYKKALVAAVSGMGLAAIIAGYAICLAAPTVQTSVSGKAASATHSWQGNTLYITAYPKANWRFVEGYTVAEDGVVDGVNGGHWYDLRGNFTCILRGKATTDGPGPGELADWGAMATGNVTYWIDPGTETLKAGDLRDFVGKTNSGNEPSDWRYAVRDGAFGEWDTDHPNAYPFNMPPEKYVLQGRSRADTSNTAQAQITVVGVKSIRADCGSTHEVSESTNPEDTEMPTLTVLEGDDVTFTATQDPVDVMWPNGEPVWESENLDPEGEQLGVSGTGVSKSATGVKPGTYRIKASCGTSSRYIKLEVVELVVNLEIHKGWDGQTELFVSEDDEEDAPGRFIPLNDGPNENGVPAFADSAHNRGVFTHLRLTINDDSVDLSKLSLTLTYPACGKDVTAPTAAQNYRIWKANSSNSLPSGAADAYIASGEADLEALGFTASNRSVSFVIEAVHGGDSEGGQAITATLSNKAKGTSKSDTVRVNAAAVDLDIDSNNDGTISSTNDAEEDWIENLGTAEHPGKFVAANDDDDDYDGIVDLDDLYIVNPNKPNEKENDWERLKVSVSSSLSSSAEVQFSYDTAYVKIWKKSPTDSRTTDDVVQPGVWTEVSELQNLWIEGQSGHSEGGTSSIGATARHPNTEKRDTAGSLLPNPSDAVCVVPVNRFRIRDDDMYWNYAVMDMPGKTDTQEKRSRLLIGVRDDDKAHFTLEGTRRGDILYEVTPSGGGAAVVSGTFAALDKAAVSLSCTSGSADYNVKYVLDNNANGTIDGGDTIFSSLSVRIFSREYRDDAISVLTTRAGWADALLNNSLSALLLYDFIDKHSSYQGGVTASVTNSVQDVRASALTHNCGAYFSESSGLASVPFYVFGEASSISSTVAHNSDFVDVIHSLIRSHDNEVKTHFTGKADGYEHSFEWTLPSSAVTFGVLNSGDLFAAIYHASAKRIKVWATYKMSTHWYGPDTADLKWIKVWADVEDLYDFNYYGDSGINWVFPADKAAALQVGWGRGIGAEGRINTLQINVKADETCWYTIGLDGQLLHSTYYNWVSVP